MDPKASAKSKRNHSKHGRQAHATPAAVAARKAAKAAVPHPPGPAAQNPNPTSKGRSLPSNWDRYGGEDDENNEAVGEAEKHGEVKPKSKGADFGFLIEQARAQPIDWQSGVDLLPSSSASFEGIMFDFVQGASSMLSARGKGLVSWCCDDDFVVDDERTPSYEVPFLSMDLDAITVQLSKIKKSRRLFAEARYLPEELYVDESVENQMDDTSEALPTKCENELHPSVSFGGIGPSLVDTDGPDNFSPHQDCIVGRNPLPSAIDGIIQVQRSESEQSQLPFSQGSVLPSRIQGRPRTEQIDITMSETTVVEAELDDLLDPLNETNISSTLADDLTENISMPHNATFDSLIKKDQKLATLDLTSTKIAGSPLDDDIDSLLAETAFCIKDNNKSVGLSKVAASFATSTSFKDSACTYDDASLKQSGAAALNDDIDDLLAETSLCPKDSDSILEGGAVSTKFFHSFVGSKPLQDTRQGGGATTLDDDLDDLLAATSLS